MTSEYFPLDVRAYVREELQLRQRRRPQYSLRAFARDLEMSPSSLCEFLASRQGLSRARAVWISEKLKLTKDQTEHFCDLLQSQFGHSDRDKKAAAFRAMDRARSTKSQLALENFRLIADWYHFVLLEILSLDRGPKSLSEISTLLDVSVPELENAVGRLVTLGFLRVDGQGEDRAFTVLNEVTTVGEEVSDRAVQISHQQTLRMHADAVDRKSFADRENLTIAFSIRQDQWLEIRKEIKNEVLKVVARFANEPGPKDQTVSFTMQMINLIPKPGETEA